MVYMMYEGSMACIEEIIYLQEVESIDWDMMVFDIDLIRVKLKD